MKYNPKNTIVSRYRTSHVTGENPSDKFPRVVREMLEDKNLEHPVLSNEEWESIITEAAQEVGISVSKELVESLIPDLQPAVKSE